ncbi:hypothetical protein COO72_11105 [Bifidobacterium callitrichos]|nr:hypothetical protein COO72_11105 [Bifidobacterium callitrichos]
MTTATQIPLPSLQSLEPNPKQAPAVSTAADAATPNQTAHDRGDLSDRLMAPSWWYPVGGTINGAIYLMTGILFTQEPIQGPEISAYLHRIILSALIMAACLTLFHVSNALSKWRKQQIGTEFTFDITMGGLRPRNTVMKISVIAQAVVMVLAFAATIWLLPSQSVLPEGPMLVAVAMGVICGLWDYGYDRYFVHTLKRGR